MTRLDSGGQRSKIKVIAGRQGGECIHIDARVSKSIRLDVARVRWPSYAIHKFKDDVTLTEVITIGIILVVFLFCISYVTNLALWLQDFNKLTYLPLGYMVISSWDDRLPTNGRGQGHIIRFY